MMNSAPRYMDDGFSSPSMSFISISVAREPICERGCLTVVMDGFKAFIP